MQFRITSADTEMNTFDSLKQSPLSRSWVTIGAFDGVHVGHRSIFEDLVSGARAAGCEAVAITFHPLPAIFFKRINAGCSLATLEEREGLILECGIDRVITLKFDQDLANVEASTFMELLKKKIGIVKLMVGFNFALGKDRKGNVSELSRLGQELGYTVEVTEPVRVEGDVVSSSRIRKLLLAGDVQKATRFLGRPYRLTGEVVHGEHRGTKLGIPTANLAIPSERLMPANGVYATLAYVAGKTYQSVTNIGVRPTFDNPLPTPRVEPHLLDVSDALYQETLTLEFIEFLRSEVKFPDSQSLIAQINQDIQKTREVLANHA